MYACGYQFYHLYLLNSFLKEVINEYKCCPLLRMDFFQLVKPMRFQYAYHEVKAIFLSVYVSKSIRIYINLRTETLYVENS